MGVSRSSTGPANFELRYSTDGVAFTPAMSYEVPQVSWSSLSPADPPVTSFSADLSAIVSLNNASEVLFRLVATSAPSGSAGSSRVDNFTVTQVPEPSTYALMALAAGGWFAARRRRK